MDRSRKVFVLVSVISIFLFPAGSRADLQSVWRGMVSGVAKVLGVGPRNLPPPKQHVSPGTHGTESASHEATVPHKSLFRNQNELNQSVDVVADKSVIADCVDESLMPDPEDTYLSDMVFHENRPMFARIASAKYKEDHGAELLPEDFFFNFRWSLGIVNRCEKAAFSQYTFKITGAMEVTGPKSNAKFSQEFDSGGSPQGALVGASRDLAVDQAVAGLKPVLPSGEDKDGATSAELGFDPKKILTFQEYFRGVPVMEGVGSFVEKFGRLEEYWGTVIGGLHRFKDFNLTPVVTQQQAIDRAVEEIPDSSAASAKATLVLHHVASKGWAPSSIASFLPGHKPINNDKPYGLFWLVSELGQNGVISLLVPADTELEAEGSSFEEWSKDPEPAQEFAPVALNAAPPPPTTPAPVPDPAQEEAEYPTWRVKCSGSTLRYGERLFPCVQEAENKFSLSSADGTNPYIAMLNDYLLGEEYCPSNALLNPCNLFSSSENFVFPPEKSPLRAGVVAYWSAGMARQFVMQKFDHDIVDSKKLDLHLRPAATSRLTLPDCSYSNNHCSAISVNGGYLLDNGQVVPADEDYDTIAHAICHVVEDQTSLPGPLGTTPEAEAVREGLCDTLAMLSNPESETPNFFGKYIGGGLKSYVNPESTGNASAYKYGKYKDVSAAAPCVTGDTLQEQNHLCYQNINSTVISRVFYYLLKGGTLTNPATGWGVNIQPLNKDIVIQLFKSLWRRPVMEPLSFKQAATLLIQSANALGLSSAGAGNPPDKSIACSVTNALYAMNVINNSCDFREIVSPTEDAFHEGPWQIKFKWQILNLPIQGGGSGSPEEKWILHLSTDQDFKANVVSKTFTQEQNSSTDKSKYFEVLLKDPILKQSQRYFWMICTGQDDSVCGATHTFKTRMAAVEIDNPEKPPYFPLQQPVMKWNISKALGAKHYLVSIKSDDGFQKNIVVADDNGDGSLLLKPELPQAKAGAVQNYTWWVQPISPASGDLPTKITPEAHFSVEPLERAEIKNLEPAADAELSLDSDHPENGVNLKWSEITWSYGDASQRPHTYLLTLMDRSTAIALQHVIAANGDMISLKQGVFSMSENGNSTEQRTQFRLSLKTLKEHPGGICYNVQAIGDGIDGSFEKKRKGPVSDMRCFRVRPTSFHFFAKPGSEYEYIPQDLAGALNNNQTVSILGVDRADPNNSLCVASTFDYNPFGFKAYWKVVGSEQEEMGVPSGSAMKISDVPSSWHELNLEGPLVSGVDPCARDYFAFHSNQPPFENKKQFIRIAVFQKWPDEQSLYLNDRKGYTVKVRKRPVCGDGELDSGLDYGTIHAAAEQCDDGNNQPNDGCENCQTAGICGNGVVEAGEQCDGGAHCKNCVREPYCGDGVVNVAGEECDGGQGCDGSCKKTQSCEAIHDPALTALPSSEYAGGFVVMHNGQQYHYDCGPGATSYSVDLWMADVLFGGSPQQVSGYPHKFEHFGSDVMTYPHTSYNQAGQLEYLFYFKAKCYDSCGHETGWGLASPESPSGAPHWYVP